MCCVERNLAIYIYLIIILKKWCETDTLFVIKEDSKMAVFKEIVSFFGHLNV